jgi:NADH dehydrogenase
MKHRVVIIGGGFGGLYAATTLTHSSVAVTLIDRRNFHLFQPLLYQVATGGLSPANIAAPLRAVLRKRRNIEVVLGEVVDIDAAQREVILRDDRIAYDSLIVATGARHHYFGNPQWEALAPSLKTVEDATKIRRRILTAFETAERSDVAEEIARCLTFVIAGAGPTGVELAGALGELAQHTLRNNFRHIDPSQARILLVEGTERVLPMYPPDLSTKAQQSLERLGVTVICNARVTDISEQQVTITHNGETKDSEVIPARTVLWAAGVQASKLGQALARATGAELDRNGRVKVGRDCTVAGHPEIFVIGDLAAHQDKAGQQLPGMAPVAIQQGRYVARVIQRRLRGQATQEFVYKDHGQMSTIGRAAAVAQIGKVHLSGFIAWLAWLLVHLLQLVGFENRILVFVQWAGNYLTRNKAARLITGTSSTSKASKSPGQPTSGDPQASNPHGTKVASELSPATSEK